MVERLDLAARPDTSDSGERSVNDIRRKIARERETIKDTVDKLSGRLQQSLDWREYVATYPAAALGLAAGAGLLLSAIFRREPSPGERIKQAVADLAEDLTERVSDVASDTLNRRSQPRGSVLKGAATTLAAQAAIDFLKRKIGEPGDRRRIDRPSLSARQSQAWRDH